MRLHQREAVRCAERDGRLPEKPKKSIDDRWGMRQCPCVGVDEGEEVHDIRVIHREPPCMLTFVGAPDQNQTTCLPKLSMLLMWMDVRDMFSLLDHL